MPRYYFHIRQGPELIHDLEGHDLPDIRTALREAEAAVREMAADRLRRGLDPKPPVIEIADDGGHAVASFELPGDR